MNTVLGIAAYRSPDSVRDLVSIATSPTGVRLFDIVLVVDSHGDDSVPGYIEDNGLADRVRYYNAEGNLGAAGNLDKRLRWAAETGADLMFAINADGHLDLEVAQALFSHARRHECGAVYPARRMAGDCYDFTGILRFPWRTVRRREENLAVAEAVRVFWSSSNGAVYSLRPIMEGIVPPVGLWHGWEDMAWGLLLERAGYRQALLPSVRVESSYEMRGIGDSTVPTSPYSYVSDKPTWLTYYTSRNLLLTATRVVPGTRHVLGAATRILIELAVTLAYRDRKLERLRLLMRGVADGLTGRQGMIVRPTIVQ